MITVNVQDAKNNLSRYLALMEEGERVILCRRNVPIAELTPVRQASRESSALQGFSEPAQAIPDGFSTSWMPAPPPKQKKKRPPRQLGLCKEKLNIPDSAFFDPLPKEILEAFYGGPPPPCISDDDETSR